MKTEYDIVKYNAKKSANQKRKFKFVLKRVLKAVIFLLIAIFAYATSYKFSGFYKTNIRLLTLFSCVAFGFALFFLLRIIFDVIAKITYAKKTKRAKAVESSQVDELNAMLFTEKYDFRYDFSLGLTDNLKHCFTLAESLVHDVAKKYGKDNKYYYLNYTVYDSLIIVNDVSSGVYDKVDGFFRALKLQDLPLNVIENKLKDLIEKEKKVEEINVKAQEQTGIKKVLSDLKQNVLHVGAKVTTFVFKNKIEETANDIIRFIGLEAFKIYGQRKVIKPAKNKGVQL